MTLLKKYLLYLTNNEATSRHEESFDIAFLIINTIALVAGVILFMYQGDPEWIPVLVIEYIWALDNIRHNRE